MEITERIKALNFSARMNHASEPKVLTIEWQPSAPVSGTALFRYVSDPELLRTWSPIVPNRALTSTGPATCQESPGMPRMDAEVLSVCPDHELRHRWGWDVLTWSIQEGSDATRLTLDSALSTPDLAPMNAAGWHVCFAVLESILAGAPHERIVGMDAMNFGWSKLRSEYMASLADR